MSGEGGVILNGYVLGRLLGSGAFGDVRHATREREEFAVKCLSRSFLKKQREFVSGGGGRPKIKTALDDVQREIAIMKKTKHPNLVSLIDAIDDPNDDAMYMVLEYVTGGQTMYFNGEQKKYLTKDGGVYPEPRACELFRELIEGLRYLHTQGIIHRDLKPENLLLTDKGALKIADFGIAQKLDIDENKAGSISHMQGTHHFMSPEMITEKKYSGFLVDIWAAGVCMFCFVHGSLPFWADMPDELFDAITDLEPAFSPNCSSGFREAVGRILVKDPTKRSTLDDIVKEPYFAFGKVRSVRAVELTDFEFNHAITPRLSFAAMVRLKIQVRKWKKAAAERRRAAAAPDAAGAAAKKDNGATVDLTAVKVEVGGASAAPKSASAATGANGAAKKPSTAAGANNGAGAAAPVPGKPRGNSDGCCVIS